MHHVLSLWALKQARIPNACWPVINIPQDPDHKATRTYQSSDTAKQARQAELNDIKDPQKGLFQAFDNAWNFFIQDMTNAAHSPFVSNYQALYQQLRQALIDAINAGLCNPPAPPGSGPTTTAGNPVDNNNPPLSPGAVASDSTVQMSAQGLGTSSAGMRYDLVLADSAQLAIDPHCSDSPTTISSSPVEVDSSGNIPITSVALNLVSWEGDGEGDTAAPAEGAAQLCFAEFPDHTDSATTSISFTMGGPAETLSANFNGEFSVTGDASSQAVYSTGNDPMPPTFTRTQTIHGACCAKATHTTSGTVTVATAKDRNNSSNKLPAATNYDIYFLGGNTYTSHGTSWTEGCLPSLGAVLLARGVTVSSVGKFGPATYSIPPGQSANSGANESSVCIRSGGGASIYGNQVPVTLV